MKRKKLPYAIRLMRVSLKWTWKAFIMIFKETFSPNMPKRKNEGNTHNVPGIR